MIKKLALFLFLTLSPCWAQQYDGTVYGVYPEGVMINQGAGSILIPTQHARFQLGGAQVEISKLQPGQLINAYVPQNYIPNVVPIADPYLWKMKNHPNHPHGGPPGQLKKAGQQWLPNGKAKGNKGRGKGH